MVLSSDYFESEYTQHEYQPFLFRDLDGKDRRLILFQIEPIVLPPSLNTRQIVDLQTGDFQEKVCRAIHDVFEPPLWRIERKPRGLGETPVNRRRTMQDLLGVGAFAITSASVYGLTLQPVQDQLADLLFHLTHRDISLPGDWMLFEGNFREHVLVANSSASLNNFVNENKAAVSSTVGGGQWIDLRGVNILESTFGAGAKGRNGIAQYRVGFQSGSVTLLSRVQADAKDYYAARFRYVRSHEMVAEVFRPKSPDRKLARSYPINVANRTLHELAVTCDGDRFALMYNGAVIADWKDSALEAGAFGLKADLDSSVRLFRYSLNSA